MKQTQHEARTTTLRRARHDDLEAFGAFVAGLSSTTSYRRFFTAVSRLPTAHATRLLRSGATSGAWLAWERDAVVGHGFWAAVRPDTAELALVVADCAQGRGVGRALTTASLRDATAAGIRHLELVVQRDNRLVADLVARRWPHRRAGVRDGLLVSHVTLQPVPNISSLPRPRVPVDAPDSAQSAGRGRIIQTQSRR
jgi:ribosomal protein S18 acetylase RimI-like enzyme